MSIQEISADIKRFLGQTDMFMLVLILVVGIVSFILGRISVNDFSVEEGHNPAASISAPDNIPLIVASTTEVRIGKEPEEPAVISEGYVASRNGTKYHLPWCSGALRIKEENKIWFKTKAEAEAAGYSPALNCKGI